MKIFCSLIALICSISSLIAGGFGAGTLVKTPHDPRGYTAIEELKVGDIVTSFNFATSSSTENKILEIKQETVQQVVRVNVCGTWIEAAIDQSFFYPNTGIEIPALTLSTSGDLITTFVKYNLLEDIELVDSERIVYKLSIENDSNFYVTQQNILVHNEPFTFCAIALTFGAGSVAVDVGATVAALAVPFVYWFINKQKGTLGTCGSPHLGGCPGDPDPKKQKEWDNEFVENGKFKRVYDYKFNARNKPVYQRGNIQITRDADRHKGGHWKMFRTGTKQRIGTFNCNLGTLIGD